MARRLIGLLIALGGGSILAFLMAQSIDRRLEGPLFYALGMPGALLVGMVGIIALAFGLHLAVRRPGRRPR